MAIPLGLKVKSLFYALSHQWVYLDEHCTAFFSGDFFLYLVLQVIFSNFRRIYFTFFEIVADCG